MDPSKLLPAPPPASDFATWLAIVLVVCMMGFGVWIARVAFPRLIAAMENVVSAAAKEREAERAEHRADLDADREERIAQREQSARVGAEIHGRITELSERLARGEGCRSTGRV